MQFWKKWKTFSRFSFSCLPREESERERHIVYHSPPFHLPSSPSNISRRRRGKNCPLFRFPIRDSQDKQLFRYTFSVRTLSAWPLSTQNTSHECDTFFNFTAFSSSAENAHSKRRYTGPQKQCFKKRRVLNSHSRELVLRVPLELREVYNLTLQMRERN